VTGQRYVPGWDDSPTPPPEGSPLVAIVRIALVMGVGIVVGIVLWQVLRGGAP
jgi:hypothetical protein